MDEAAQEIPKPEKLEEKLMPIEEPPPRTEFLRRWGDIGDPKQNPNVEIVRKGIPESFLPPAKWEAPFLNGPDRTYRWTPRSRCTACPPGKGCNAGIQELFLTKEEFELCQLTEWPTGTHFLILDVEKCGINRRGTVNPYTGIPFQKGDVIEIHSPHSDAENVNGIVAAGRIRLYGRKGLAWIPTTLPVTIGDPEKIAKFKKQVEEEVALEEARRLAEEKRWREEQERYEEEELKERQERTARKALLNDFAEPSPEAKWEDGESWMRAKTAAIFLEAQGACGNPIRYMRGWPDETPAKRVWEAVINGEINPKGQIVEFYWLTRIIGYVPRLTRESLKKIRELGVQTERKLSEDQDFYGSRHYEDSKFRAALLKVLPWEYLEFRFRQENLYQPNKWEVGLGLASKKDPSVIVTEGNAVKERESKDGNQQGAPRSDRDVRVGDGGQEARREVRDPRQDVGDPPGEPRELRGGAGQPQRRELGADRRDERRPARGDREAAPRAGAKARPPVPEVGSGRAQARRAGRRAGRR